MHVRALDSTDPDDVELGRTLVSEYVEATMMESEAYGEPVPRSMTRELFPECFDFAAVYAQPGWSYLVLESRDDVIGGAGLRRHDSSTAEMKRMWIRPVHRRRGAARQLALDLVDHARTSGYARMILDVVPQREGAIALYRSLGFVASDPVHEYPFSMIYLAREL